MIAQPYPLFARWGGKTWRVIGWLDPDGVDLAWCPVVVPHGRTAVGAIPVPPGDEYTLLVALNGSPGGDNVNGDTLWEWQIRYRRTNWPTHHRSSPNFQTRKGAARAATNYLTGNGQPIDRLTVLRRRVGQWERQPIHDFIPADVPAPAQYGDPDPRYQHNTPEA